MIVKNNRSLLSDQIIHTIGSVYLFIVLFLLINACGKKEKDTYTAIEKTITESTFAGSNSCKSCHEEQFSRWQNSHHDQAMKIADSITILGNFDNSTFIHKNVKSSFFKNGKDYFVNTVGPDGKYHDYRIEYTFGFTPLQQYIVKFPDGAYQCLLTAWDSVENKWFHLQPNLDIIHDEWINWSGGSQRWNTMCADCHSTDLQKNFDSELKTYNTTYSEINVSCEACHGPSGSHVSYYEKFPNGRNPPDLYLGKTINSKELVDKCARCHSRRAQITKVFDYKGDFFDHYIPSLLIDPIYELDGQIKDEDYVYGSFVQSKMYHNGISCKDCHDVHSLKLKKTGNDLCLTCHIPKYNTPEHHFHKENTDGAQCINCHMPGKMYMGNDFRRDHSFRVPRPDQTVKYEVPNACNGCHTDKSATWAVDFINKKYGTERADHFSDHLLKGYFDDNTSFKKVFSNTKYPELSRATALNQYTNQQLSQDEFNDILVYLKDSSALVRREVIHSFDKIGIANISTHITPLLNDSIRMVRISAARYFNTIGEQSETDVNFKNANQEFLDEMDMNADFASGQHQIAIFQQTKGNIDLAIKAYQRAIEIDDNYNMSRMNLALLYYQQGIISTSEELYLKVIEQEPDFGYSYYMLGLLYNETGQIIKALEYLATACEKVPLNINAFYNYALLLQKENKNNESIEVIERALKSFPKNEKLLYVRLIGEINLKHLDKAIETCHLLIALNPNNVNYLKILDDLKDNE